VQAFQEYQDLQQLIQQIQVQAGNKDSWEYIWGNNKYSASRFYHLPFKNLHPPHFIWIWDSKCANKIRIFTWLLFMDRLNVRNILRRKNAKLEGNNYNCVLCSQNREEITFHLFFSCPFSKECWNHLHINWNFGINFQNMIKLAKQQFPSSFFMEIFMVGAWHIWMQRNNLIFNRGVPTFQSWKAGFLHEASLQAHRMSPDKQLLFKYFLQLYRYIASPCWFCFLLCTVSCLSSLLFYIY
jgi:hypothetical protein